MALKRRAKAASNEFFPGFTDIVEIGVGSLAVVYRARELGTDRYVALKLLNVRDASPRALESFERESIALGAVSSHPNIVTLYRTFRAGDGRPVLVLELCTGSVARPGQDGPGLAPQQVVALGIKIAGALETAHRAEILHRDVKPQNILLTEYGEPALADFGVAMLQSSTQTTAGLFDFTTLHAAPELLEGRETSAATDVYELASTLYQLVAGRSAFRAHDGESPASVILRILRDPVAPIGGPAIPTQLSDVLLVAMSKEKEQRPPTAAEFAAELAGVEVAQGWARTPFLIRDPGSPYGGFSGPPVVSRTPDPGHTTPPPAPHQPPVSQLPPTVTVPRYQAPARHPPEQQTPEQAPSELPPTGTVPLLAADAAERSTWRPPPPLAPTAQAVGEPAHTAAVESAAAAVESARVTADEWSTPTLSEHRPEPAGSAPIDPAAALRDIWTAVPGLPPPAPRSPVPDGTEGDSQDVPPAPPTVVPWRETLAEAMPAATGPDTVDPDRTRERRYPAAPAATAGEAVAAVPTWAFPPPPAPQQQARFSDLRLDPMSLTPSVTIRSGAARLVVDGERMRLRSWLRRSELPWADVLAFEARFASDAPGSAGRLVAVTHNGPVELPATRRPAGELRYIHALLDAYRERAAMTGHR